MFGSNYNDILYGDANANIIYGGSGDDTIYGGGGSDILYGGDGNDTLIAGPGNSLLYGNAGSNTFKFLNASDSISTPTVAPSIIEDFKTGIDKIDISAISPTNVAIIQENGFYTLQATGWTGAILSVRSVNAFVLSDVITTIPGVTLTGTPGPDQLVGGPGNDTIIGNGSADALTGGAGDNTFVYNTASDSTPAAYDIIHDFKTGLDKVDMTALNPTSISLVRYQGGTYIFGGAASGYFEVASTQDINAADILGLQTGVFMQGGSTAGSTGVETLIGSAFGETIAAGSGIDLITGGGGADALVAGAGADTFVYNAANDSTPVSYDIIHGFKTGTDKVDMTALNPTSISLVRYQGGTYIFGGAASGYFELASTQDINASDILGLQTGVFMQGGSTAGSTSVETLTGSNLGETIAAGNGIDRIIGGGGADALVAGAGADTFVYNTASDSTPVSYDIIHGFKTGTDKVDMTALNPTSISLQRYQGGTYIFGGAVSGYFELASTQDINASDILGLQTGVFMQGGSTAGSTTVETLTGSSFGETIAAGNGIDTIIGGGGADSLVAGAGADTFVYKAISDSTTSSYDIIHGFKSGTDKVDLTAVRAGAADTFGLLNTANGSYLFVDLQGNGTTDMEIAFTSNNVTAADIKW
ncbi:M10 family metallopeptidase C-terminal domain-containing protein [Methylosinus sp. H3A]|uniref:M10 family metallopeptidase C-terminal domain-containing protein n=1 Tax=Methylosinus sp. H3A TaxID=2785786 RepID=UPI0018C25EF4|nr:M10 family metallopeptidase C-terminal domain-containing protein [Methylosinus sp. H3A]MBG0808220.1 M10 family metallopeptidase C-terminal domain-containing protein [Methylosinus sp. H3A]